MLTDLAKKLLSLTPYRIVKGSPARFQGMEHCLHRLHRLGYVPYRIVDGGAHLGSFALTAHALFPNARIYMIEPQPPCRAALESLAADHDFVFYPYALSAEAGTLRMICGEVPATGAHIAWPANLAEATVDVRATTLDELFASECKTTDRTLLKLDLQGHELLALKGASLMLPRVEVAIVEVSFFQQLGEPTISDMVSFFDRRGFDLFDIAALAARRRDDRLRQGDFVFVRRSSLLSTDIAWA